MLVIVVQEDPLSTDCSHLIIEPVYPESDNNPLFWPEQIAVEVVNVPPTLWATISINPGVEYAIGEIPFCTTALKNNGVLKLVTV